MKIMIIGANGRQGQCLCREAVKRGHSVVAVVKEGKSTVDGVERTIAKDLFRLTAVDLAFTDVVISAFGSGFDCDPKINREAIDHLIKICSQASKFLIINGGAGSLFSDESHTKRVYELESHPAFLRPISEQLSLGLADLKHTSGLDWVYVSPSLEFDFEGAFMGEYKVGGDTVIYNRYKISRISYRDFAAALIDEAEQKLHKGEHITICEK